MNSPTQIYKKSVKENKRNLDFWEDYLKSLKSLDFNVFSEKLTVPILVPIGSRIMFRGHLKHTNEITVVLGADYFTKCSVQQAEVLRQHRIKDAEANVDMYKKEKEYLGKQISFTKDNVYETQGQEIIEAYTEEEDRLWREKHRENLRKYRQDMKKEEKTEEYKSDEDLWIKLEELELQEELENELEEPNYIEHLNSNINIESFIIKEKESESVNKQANLEVKEDDLLFEEKCNNVNIEKESMTQQNEELEPKEILPNNSPLETPKLDLLHQVIDRQKELENTLLELKNRERAQCKNETDLISKLDEMEQLDEVEDELERLEDLLETEDVEDEQESSTLQSSVAERRVSFADGDDNSTLELTFKHSDVEACLTPYDVNKGIQKPSDIYEIHANLFRGPSTSILKKSKCKKKNISQPSKYESGNITQSEINLNKIDTLQQDSKNDNRNKTIVVKDVKERVHKDDSKVAKERRPKSLFKKMRMQSKS